MNNCIKFITAITFLLCFQVSGKTIYDYKIPMEEDEKLADQLFKDKRYAESFEIYSELAKIGDKFSQYRLSTMYLHGNGVNKDKNLSYAWANLAKEHGNELLIKEYEKIKASFSTDELVSADKIKKEYYEKYNDLRVLLEFRKLVKKSMPECTGSRMRGNINACLKTKVVCNIRLQYTNKSLGKACEQAAAMRRKENLVTLRESYKQVNQEIDEVLERRATVTVKKID